MSNRGSSSRTAVDVAVHVVIPIILAGIVNAIIYGMRWNSSAAESQSKESGQSQLGLIPPGWAIALIWVVILGFMGYSRYAVRHDPVASTAVIVVILVCLAYPFATLGLRPDLAVVANLVSLIAGFTGAIFVYSARKLALLPLLPLLVWLTYVNIVTSLAHAQALQ